MKKMLIYTTLFFLFSFIVSADLVCEPSREAEYEGKCIIMSDDDQALINFDKAWEEIFTKIRAELTEIQQTMINIVQNLNTLFNKIVVLESENTILKQEICLLDNTAIFCSGNYTCTDEKIQDNSCSGLSDRNDKGLIITCYHGLEFTDCKTGWLPVLK